MHIIEDKPVHIIEDKPIKPGQPYNCRIPLHLVSKKDLKKVRDLSESMMQWTREKNENFNQKLTSTNPKRKNVSGNQVVIDILRNDQKNGTLSQKKKIYFFYF